MTKKDFELIAQVLDVKRREVKAGWYPGHDEDTLAFLDAVAEHFAARLQETNPRFDTDRFLAATGVEL